MEMKERPFTIFYHQSVVKIDIPKISRGFQIRIQEAIEEKLTTNPEIFGKPLRRSLSGYRKLRVGDYRVIFRIEKQIIKILVIGHRKDVYKISEIRN